MPDTDRAGISRERMSSIDSTRRETDVPRARAYAFALATTCRSTLSVSFCIRIILPSSYVSTPVYPLAMSEKHRIVDLSERVMEGEPWHAGNIAVLLADVTAEEAAARPISGAHSI